MHEHEQEPPVAVESKTGAIRAAGTSQTVIRPDEGLAYRTVAGELTPANRLLRLIAERLQVAAGHLRLSKDDLRRIFSRHDVFEADMRLEHNGRAADFLLVETYHHLQGMVGKGALKLIFPKDLAGEGGRFRSAGENLVEVLPPPGQAGWSSAALAEETVKHAMREFMTGETLSMSLKSQATGAPFAGSEGLVLCATREFQPSTGQYFLREVLRPTEEAGREDKELIELMLNHAAELLTRPGRIGFDRIVHAAETNSTLTAKLDLQLPVNVVEGHLRSLLREQPAMLIGDEDMTARLRELLEQPAYQPTACVLARAAARMQMEHSLLTASSREKLRRLLSELPAQGTPSPAQYREVLDLFFGRGEVQRSEDQLYHHREPMLRTLSIALSASSLDDCGEPDLLAFYLRTLLDNQRIMLEVALLNRLQGQPLPVDWFERAPLLSREQERRLAALVPTPNITRDVVKENFWEIVNLLAEAKAELPRYTPDPHLQARKEVLERATRAITSAGDVVPSTDRIVFFTLPYAYECVTPRLGVVTRKPVSVCGSELRPEGMAAGGVMSIDILLKQLTGKAQPLQGLTVTIEGLGNAGKHVATSVMQRGATVRGVSDSRGALLCPGGFNREELAVIIAHKNAGRRLDSLLTSPAARHFPDREGTPIVFVPEPAALHRVRADILVLAAIPGTIHLDNAPALNVSIVCELTGAGVSLEAKRILEQRDIHVIPDNLASSGGLLVSLWEMLQNSAGQNWDRKLEESRLYQQLARSFDSVLRLAQQHKVDLPTASDILALHRMHELALYRELLEAAARALQARLQAIGAGDRVLIVSDEDEDGVASAAILDTLIAQLVPGAERRVEFLSESLRTDGILDRVRASSATSPGFKHVFVLDRALPPGEKTRERLAELAHLATLTIVNNNTLTADRLQPGPAGSLMPGDQPVCCSGLNILFISPQTLRATGRAREFSTALTLREIGRLLPLSDTARERIDWQAAVAGCLDVPEEPSSEWVWFFTQFNPDRTYDAARAIRMVTRAGGFLNAVHALAGVQRPGQLETDTTWRQFMTEYRLLNERIQLLVDKIVVENRSRPFTAHFFTREEVASPTPVAGDASNELSLYTWFSEHLTGRGNLAEKPIIMGQLLQEPQGPPTMGVRIRSPRGVDLMEAGLPEQFVTGGLPNTAVARIPLPPGASPEFEFARLVEAIWMRTTNPIYLAASAGVEDR